MSTGLIILIVFLIFLLYLLFFPISILADTFANKYYAGIPGIVGFRIMKRKDSWKIQFSIFFLRFKVDFFKRMSGKDHEVQERRISKAKRSKKSVQFYLRFMIKILSTFRIKKLVWRLDTGDYPLNAQLIPIVSSLNSDRISISVNFYDRNEFHLLVQTSVFRLLFISMKYYMFNK